MSHCVLTWRCGLRVAQSLCCHVVRVIVGASLDTNRSCQQIVDALVYVIVSVIVVALVDSRVVIACWVVIEVILIVIIFGFRPRDVILSATEMLPLFKTVKKELCPLLHMHFSDRVVQRLNEQDHLSGHSTPEEP